MSLLLAVLAALGSAIGSTMESLGARGRVSTWAPTRSPYHLLGLAVDLRGRDLAAVLALLAALAVIGFAGQPQAAAPVTRAATIVLTAAGVVVSAAALAATRRTWKTRVSVPALLAGLCFAVTALAGRTLHLRTPPLDTPAQPPAVGEPADRFDRDARLHGGGACGPGRSAPRRRSCGRSRWSSRPRPRSRCWTTRSGQAGCPPPRSPSVSWPRPPRYSPGPGPNRPRTCDDRLSSCEARRGLQTARCDLRLRAERDERVQVERGGEQPARETCDAGVVADGQRVEGVTVVLDRGFGGGQARQQKPEPRIGPQRRHFAAGIPQRAQRSGQRLLGPEHVRRILERARADGRPARSPHPLDAAVGGQEPFGLVEQAGSEVMASA